MLYPKWNENFLNPLFRAQDPWCQLSVPVCLYLYCLWFCIKSWRIEWWYRLHRWPVSCPLIPPSLANTTPNGKAGSALSQTKHSCLERALPEGQGHHIPNRGDAFQREFLESSGNEGNLGPGRAWVALGGGWGVLILASDFGVSAAPVCRLTL